MVRLRAEESATAVRVSVVDYQEQAGPTTTCPAIGYVGTPQLVVLTRPIGDREVVDVGTGKPQTLLVAADYPRLSAPAGFTALPFGQVWGLSQATQAWEDKNGEHMWLETAGPSSPTDSTSGRLVRQFSLHGSTARMHNTGGLYPQWQVQWTPNNRQTITLRLNDSPQRRWTADEVQALAQKVTNYRTEKTAH